MFCRTVLLLCGSHDCWGRVCVCVSSYIRVPEGGRAGLCIFLLLHTGLRWVIHTGSSLGTGGTSSSLLPSSITISSSIQKTSGCSSRVPCPLFLRWMGNLHRLRCARTWRQWPVSLETVSGMKSLEIWVWRCCLFLTVAFFIIVPASSYISSLLLGLVVEVSLLLNIANLSYVGNVTTIHYCSNVWDR